MNSVHLLQLKDQKTRGARNGDAVAGYLIF